MYTKLNFYKMKRIMDQKLLFITLSYMRRFFLETMMRFIYKLCDPKDRKKVNELQLFCIYWINHDYDSVSNH